MIKNETVVKIWLAAAVVGAIVGAAIAIAAVGLPDLSGLFK